MNISLNKEQDVETYWRCWFSVRVEEVMVVNKGKEQNV